MDTAKVGDKPSLSSGLKKGLLQRGTIRSNASKLPFPNRFGKYFEVEPKN